MAAVLILSSHSILACGAYYVLWIWILPHFGGYRIRHQKLILDGGEVTHKLVKVPLEKLEIWDAEHDAVGAKVGEGSDSDGITPLGVEGGKKAEG